MTALNIGGQEPASYRDWIKQEALAVKTDGCTMSLDIFLHCCYEHDLAYYYGRDPRQAFEMGWEKAERISRGEADRRYRSCNPHWLRYRWWLLCGGGWLAWRNHRKVRP